MRAFSESPRRPGRWAIVLEDGRRFIVGANGLATIGVPRTGQPLSEAQCAALEAESAVTVIADRALDALARGRRTRRELERKFQRAGYDSGAVKAALDRVEDSGLLSDEAVARAEVSSRLRRGEAPARVRQRLRQKGIDAQTTDTAVRDVTADDGFDELAACRAAAEKRARALRALEPPIAHRRLLSFLLRRGFSGAIAGRVAREALASGGGASSGD